MLTIDWIAIGVVAAFALLGLFVGFGGGLKFFTSGIFGIAISVVVCYFLYGVVLNWQFVQDLLARFIGVLEDANNPFCDFLIRVRIDIVCMCIALFIILQILRIIIVHILRNLFEVNNRAVKAINRILGVLFFLAVAAMFSLIVFQVIAWIGGNTSVNFLNWIDGSIFKIDWVFQNNPLNRMFDSVSI